MLELLVAGLLIAGWRAELRDGRFDGESAGDFNERRATARPSHGPRPANRHAPRTPPAGLGRVERSLTMERELFRSQRALQKEVNTLADSKSEDDALNAVGNALKWVHTLEEGHCTRLGSKKYFGERQKHREGLIVGGMTWARRFEHHDLVRIADLGDQYSDHYTAMYGVLVWRRQLPPNTRGKAHGRDDYFPGLPCG